MMPTNMTPDQIAAERDHYKKELQQLILQRPSFTDAELAELRSVGVSFDPATKQLWWTPMNGSDPLVAEWNAYHHSVLALMDLPEWTWTREDLEEMDKNGVTGEQLVAEIDEMFRQLDREGKGP